MYSKKIIFLITIIIAIVATGVFLLLPQQLKITDKQITDNTKPFVIKITYPQVAGLDVFNKEVLNAVNNEISNFKTNSLENDAAVKKIDPVDYAKYPRTYELDISYDKGEIDNNIASVVFNVYNFEGGAHGESYFVPLNYDIKNKKEILKYMGIMHINLSQNKTFK